MKTIMIGAAIALLFSTAAFANGGPKPPPATTPAAPQQLQGQGQAQGQIQGQLQGQGQLQSLKNTVYGPTVSPTIDNRSTGGDARGGDQTQSQSVDNRGAGANSNNYQQSGIPASTATAPSFAIGQCQWAISGGAQVFGWGLSGGGAGMYEFCKPIMKAKHFYDIGKPSVAKNLECNYSEFKEAYRMAGEPCRNDMSKSELAAADGQATTALSTKPIYASRGECLRMIPSSASQAEYVRAVAACPQ